jgi:hypothetical protein
MAQPPQRGVAAPWRVTRGPGNASESAPDRPPYPRTNFLYAMRCGWSASAPFLRLKSSCTPGSSPRSRGSRRLLGLDHRSFRREYDPSAHVVVVLYDVSCQSSLDTSNGDAVEPTIRNAALSLSHPLTLRSVRQSRGGSPDVVPRLRATGPSQGRRTYGKALEPPSRGLRSSVETAWSGEC